MHKETNKRSIDKKIKEKLNLFSLSQYINDKYKIKSKKMLIFNKNKNEK